MGGHKIPSSRVGSPRLRSGQAARRIEASSRVGPQGRIEGRALDIVCGPGPDTHISLTGRSAAVIQALAKCKDAGSICPDGEGPARKRGGPFPCANPDRDREDRGRILGPKKGRDARCLDAGSCNALRGTLLTPPEPFRSAASLSSVPRTRRPSSHSTVLPQPFRALVALGPEGPFPHRHVTPQSIGDTNIFRLLSIFSGDYSVDKQLNYNMFWISRWKTGGQLTPQPPSCLRRRPASFSPVSK